MAKDHVFRFIMVEKRPGTKPLWFASTKDRVLLVKGTLRERLKVWRLIGLIWKLRQSRHDFRHAWHADKKAYTVLKFEEMCRAVTVSWVTSYAYMAHVQTAGERFTFCFVFVFQSARKVNRTNQTNRALEGGVQCPIVHFSKRPMSNVHFSEKWMSIFLTIPMSLSNFQKWNVHFCAPVNE